MTKSQRGSISNCVPQQSGENVYNHKSNVVHSSHSDSDTQTGLPCFQSYRIPTAGEKESSLLQKEWGPGPAPPCYKHEQNPGPGREVMGPLLAQDSR